MWAVESQIAEKRDLVWDWPNPQNADVDMLRGTNFPDVLDTVLYSAGTFGVRETFGHKSVWENRSAPVTKMELSVDKSKIIFFF